MYLWDKGYKPTVRDIIDIGTLYQDLSDIPALKHLSTRQSLDVVLPLERRFREEDEL